MKVIVNGKPARAIRVTCYACDCVFEFFRKEAKRMRIPYAVAAMGHWTDYKIDCPHCGRTLREESW